MYIYYIVAAIVIAIDQFTKWLVVKHMDLYESIPVIDNFFYLTSHRNSGAAWGILQGQMGLFYIITVIVIIGIIYYMQKFARDSKLSLLALSLVLGGAIGNFIDRLFRKEVVDFLDFTIIRYDYPIFNVADSALVVGVILIFITIYLEERSKDKQ